MASVAQFSLNNYVKLFSKNFTLLVYASNVHFKLRILWFVVLLPKFQCIFTVFTTCQQIFQKDQQKKSKNK